MCFPLQRNFLRLPAPPAGGATVEAVNSGDAVAPLLVQAVLNPLSKPAQRLAPLLRFLRTALGAETQLLLNPQARPPWMGAGWRVEQVTPQRACEHALRGAWRAPKART